MVLLDRRHRIEKRPVQLRRRLAHDVIEEHLGIAGIGGRTRQADVGDQLLVVVDHAVVKEYAVAQVEGVGVAGAGGVRPGGFAQVQDQHRRGPRRAQDATDPVGLFQQADAALMHDQLSLPIEGQAPAILVSGRIAGHDPAAARQLAETGQDPLMFGIVEMGDSQNPAHSAIPSLHNQSWKNQRVTNTAITMPITSASRQTGTR